MASIALSNSSPGPSPTARPVRLNVAPLIPLLAAFAAGIALDHLTAPCDAVTWINMALVTITVACVLLRGRRISSLAVLAAVLATGGAWNHVCWNNRSPQDLSWSTSETPRPAWVRGVITEVLGTRTSPGYGPGDPDRILSRMDLAITSISDGSLWKHADGRALLTVNGDCTELHAGQPVEAAGQLSSVSGPLNPGEFDYRAFLRTRGIFLRLSVDGPSGVALDPTGAEWVLTRWLGDLRAYCRARLTAQLDDRTAPLASALILGQRDEIDPEINDAFARTGTTHLLAISGLQLQALAVFFLFLFRLLMLPRRLSYMAVGAVTIGYAVLVGLAPSVVRSAVMTLAFCLAVIVQRPTRSANTLALAGLLTLAWNPFYLFDVGCQLSFLAIAALIWLAPIASRFFQELTRRAGSALHRPSQPIEELKKKFEPAWRSHLRRSARWIAQMVMTSAVVWLAALPLVALRFHLLSPIGILLNIPLIPLTTIAMILGATGLSLGMIWTPLGSLPILAADLLLRLSEVIVRWGVAQRWGHRFVAGPSLNCVIAFYVLLVLAALATWAVDRGFRLGKQQTWLGLLWASVALPMIPGWLLAGDGRGTTPQGDLFAVGHGLAVSLQLEDGYTMLYDCGRMGDPRVGRRIIAPALWSRGITRLDEVILSHADQDHYGALPDLLDRFRIGTVVIPPGFVSEQNPGAAELLADVRSRGIPVRTIAAPTSWKHGSTRFHVLHPPADWHPEASDNARSLVLEVEHSGHRLLLTGDLDQIGVVELASQPKVNSTIDLMLAPHHGGKSANPLMLYDWARPRAVVVSQRMPAPGTTDALTSLERSGVPLLRTWQRGAVHFRWRKNQIIAEGFLDQQGPTRSRSFFPKKMN